MSLGKIKEKLENFDELLGICKTIFKILQKLFVLIPTVFVFIASLLNFNRFKNFVIDKKILSEKTINFISDNSIGIISLFLVILIIILIFTIRKTGKKELEAIANTYNIINKLHNDFTHKLRDGIYDLYLKNNRIIELKSNNNTDAIQEVQGRAYDNLIINLQNFVDLIADCLSSYNKDIISVCIKIINSGQDGVDNLDKKAKTLVRSKNTKRERIRTNENVILSQNTDFKHLCDGTNIWYHGVDLKRKYEKHEYENEAHQNDWQKKYNSTIVVPIRYYNTNDSVPINDILGFICIDSKNIIKNWDRSDSFELQYLAIFADSIYTYIKLFRRLFDER